MLIFRSGSPYFYQLCNAISHVQNSKPIGHRMTIALSILKLSLIKHRHPVSPFLHDEYQAVSHVTEYHPSIAFLQNVSLSCHGFNIVTRCRLFFKTNIRQALRSLNITCQSPFFKTSDSLSCHRTNIVTYRFPFLQDISLMSMN